MTIDDSSKYNPIDTAEIIFQLNTSFVYIKSVIRVNWQEHFKSMLLCSHDGIIQTVA